MDEAYAVFDTLSIGSDYDLGTPAPASDPGPLTSDPKAPGADGVAPVLARVPHVESTELDQTDLVRVDPASEPISQAQSPLPATKPSDKPTQQSHERIDARGMEAHPHTWAAEAAPTEAVSLRSAIGNVDGVSRRVDAAPEPSLSESVPVAETATDRDETSASLAETLLRLDAIISPYSRWIALAAVVAAIGLTLVLLRGNAGSAPLGDAPIGSGNQVQAPAEASVFADLGPLDPIAPVTTKNLDVIATASGPASAPIVVSSPIRAAAASPESIASRPAIELTGEVLPPSAPAVAIRPYADGYPRTAGYPTTDGSTQR